VISLLIAVHNGLEWFPGFLRTVLRNTEGEFEIVIVHDACDPARCFAPERAMGARPPNMRALREARLSQQSGFSRAMNIASHLADADSKYFVLMNIDIEVPRGWDGRLVAAAEMNPSYAALIPLTGGCKTVPSPLEFLPSLPRTTDHRSRETARLIDEAAQRQYRDGEVIEKPMVPFFCALVPRWAWDAQSRTDPRAGKPTVGCFDDGFCDMKTCFGLGEDDDWCFRARLAGYRVGVVPNVYVWHRGQVIFTDEHRRRVLDRQMKYLAAKYGVERFHHGLVRQ